MAERSALPVVNQQLQLLRLLAGGDMTSLVGIGCRDYALHDGKLSRDLSALVAGALSPWSQIVPPVHATMASPLTGCQSDVNCNKLVSVAVGSCQARPSFVDFHPSLSLMAMVT